MTVAELLKTAREIVHRGWAPEPEHHGACTAFDDSECSFSDEGAWKFSVVGAIACTSGERYPLESPTADAAIRALERIACPMYVAFEERKDPPFESMTPDQRREALTAMRLASDGPLSAWLEVPGRTLTDVLSVFDRAIQRERFLTENRR